MPMRIGACIARAVSLFNANIRTVVAFTPLFNTRHSEISLWSG